jgi:hypothetical protein
MDTVHNTLLEIEHELGSASGDAYRRHLAEEAVVIVPGHALGHDACIAAIEQSPGWDEFEITDPRVLEVGADGALLTYRWRSRRGDAEYVALMSTVYARRDGAWRVVLHQQTPQPG